MASFNDAAEIRETVPNESSLLAFNDRHFVKFEDRFLFNEILKKRILLEKI